MRILVSNLKVTILVIFIIYVSKIEFENHCKAYFERVLEKHPNSEQQLLAWYRVTLKAELNSPNEIKKTTDNNL